MVLMGPSVGTVTVMVLIHEAIMTYFFKWFHNVVA